MSADKKCLCGLPKAPGGIVCTECWRTAPDIDRAQLKSLENPIRLGAVRRLLAHATRRGNAARQLTLL